jgi:homoserine dehydrogenase
VVKILKRIVILGFGTVGSGIVELIERNSAYLKSKYHDELKITGILVRDVEKHQGKGADGLLTTSFEDLLNQAPEIAVEVLGGIEPAFTYVSTLLRRGVSVVTANKDLIAEHGLALMEIARANGVSLSFEASVGGGIPVIKPFRESLKGNRIESIAGIVNGTTNFILSKMYDENLEYGKSLALAQEAGFAESDPTSDVKGYDAARKLCILSSIAYDKMISWKEIKIEGVDAVTKTDIQNAREIDRKIKLLALSHRDGSEIHCSVRPVLVHKHSALGHIDNEYNAVEVVGDAVGKVMFTGKGAGRMPTASAVYGDLLDVLTGKTDMVLPLNDDSNYKLSKYYSRRSKWLVRLKVSKMSETIDLVLGSFPIHALKLYRLNDLDNIFFVVETADELELYEKIVEMKSRDFVEDVRYFLMYD